MGLYKALQIRSNWPVYIFWVKRWLEKLLGLLLPFIKPYTVTYIVPQRKNAKTHRRKFDHHFLSVMAGKKLHGTIMPAIPVLASVTPFCFKIRVEDENIEKLSFDMRVDVVAITATTALIERAYEIADRYRENGITVILGGIHVSIFPDEALFHADAVIIGEAEDIWPHVLKDFIKKKLKKKYQAQTFPVLDKQPLPRYDLVRNRRYTFHSIQTIRGCPNECRYCSVPQFCGRKYRCKSVNRVIEEIQLLKTIQKKMLYICDDNFTLDIKRTKEILRKIIPLKVYYPIQARLEIYKDPELLDLLHDSGCVNIVMGLESVNQENLRWMKKTYDVDLYCEAIRKIQSHGLLVSGSFMFGQDGDDITVFEKTVKLIDDSNMGHSIINIMTPLPGTALYEQMKKEDRLLKKNWTDFDLKTVCFQPKKMTAEELYNGFCWVYQNVFDLNKMYSRIINVYNVWNKGGKRLEKRDFLLKINLVSHDMAYSYPKATFPRIL